MPSDCSRTREVTLILITGAAGKTGRAIIRTLSAKDEAVRALVHRPEQVQMVKDLAAQQVLVGDMRDQETIDEAARGVRAIYHICPNMSPDEVTIAQAVMAAAILAGVQCFVYHSVLHPQAEAMPHHWQKLRVEEQLFESGLAYTILQPAAYMQNVLAHWDQILQAGIYPVPYAAETQLGMVDLEDVAAAAAAVLTEAGHLGATYELAGPDLLSQSDIATILEQQLERPVRTEVVSLKMWERNARALGLGDYQTATLVKMFRYYECFGFWGNPRVLGWLIGRPPTTFAAFVERILEEPVER